MFWPWKKIKYLVYYHAQIYFYRDFFLFVYQFTDYVKHFILES
jgi:hypothetical protein